MGRQQAMKRSGFTLTEVLIAVLVIGIIMALAGSSLIKAREQSRLKEARSQTEIFATAILQLAWDTGQWPGGQDRTTLDREFSDLSASEVGLLVNDGTFTGWKGPYIRDIPKDPWGNSYFFDSDYYPNGHGNPPVVPVVGSHGPNGSALNVYDSDNIYVVLD